jgi:CheY-like chemotaxis protein
MSMSAYHLAMVLAVVDDLLFSSKIRAVAAGAGEAVTFVRTPGGVKAACAEHQPRLVLIDLDRDALNPIETIAAIRGMPAPVPRIVAFGAHVNVDRLRAARDAGADQAMARSAFVVALPGLLGGAVAEGPES